MESPVRWSSGQRARTGDSHTAAFTNSYRRAAAACHWPLFYPVETDYACIYFNNMRVDMRSGTTSYVEQPPVSPCAWMNGRTSSPNGWYAVVQNEQQLVIQAPSGQAHLLADSLNMPAWNNLNWSPDSRYVMLGQPDRLRIFDASSMKAIFEIPFTEQSGGSIFYGWSPDSAYFAFADFQGIRIWSAADGRVLEVPKPPDSIPTIHFAWSPNTSTLAYVWMAASNPQAYVSLYTPGQGRQQQASEQDYHHTAMHVFGTDGTAKTLLLRRVFDPRGWLVSDQIFWQADSRALLWYEETWEASEAPYRFMEFALDTQVVIEHAADLPNRPSYSPDHQHIALTTHHDTGRKIKLLNTFDWTNAALIEDADDAGDVTWSPDGRYAAVVWAQGEGGGREVYLTWAG